MDIAALAGFGFAATAAGWALFYFSESLFEGQAIVIGLAVALFLLLARSTGVYRTEKILDRSYSVRRLALALCLTFAVLIVVGAATKTSQAYSRIWFFSWAALTCVLAPTARLVAIGFTKRRLAKDGFVFRAMSAGIFCDALTPGEVSELTLNQADTLYSFRFDTVQQLQSIAHTIAHDEIDQIYLTVP
jgi:polysaccharide biosynthesis protein PslA